MGSEGDVEGSGGPVQESRSQLFFPLVWLATTAALLVAFQTVGIPQALGDEGARPGLQPSAFTMTPIDTASLDESTVLYGGLLYTLGEVRVTPADVLLDRALIEVDLTVTNTLPATDLRISDRDLSLLTHDGRTLADGWFADAGSRLPVPAGAEVAATFVLRTGYAANPNPRNLQLVIGEPNRVPAVLPLDGPRADDQAPLFAAVDATPTLLEDPDDAQRQIVVEPQAAVLGLNAGPYRAAEGERLALVSVKVQRAASTGTARYLDADYWALAAGDELVAPIVVEQVGAVGLNADEVTLLFAFPDDADELAVVAGAGTEQAGRFALVLPEQS